MERAIHFRLRRTPKDKRVAYAAFNLLDDAQLWYYRLKLNGGNQRGTASYRWSTTTLVHH
jgi:hypothetical protein